MAARPRDFKSLVTTDFTTLAKVRENQPRLEKLHESSPRSILSNYITYMTYIYLQDLNCIVRIYSTDVVSYILSFTIIDTVDTDVYMSFL